MRLKLRKETRHTILIVSPFLAFLSVFVVYPLAASLFYTFHDFSLRDLNPVFRGPGNWIEMFSDAVFLISLRNSLYFLAITTVVSIPLGLGVALLLNEQFRGRTIARVCLLLPWATPPVVVALMFWWIFNAAYGIVNFSMVEVGAFAEDLSFFSTPFLVLNVLSIIFAWKVFPLYAIIFLSSLQNVPTEVVESSKVYGASSFRRFTRITLPYLKPTIGVNAILNALLSLLYSFDLVVAITKGGPGYESYMLSFYAYLTTFWYLDAGYGATIAYFTTIVGVVFAFIVISRWYKD